MNDWFHELPVLWMALLVFGITYLLALGIHAAQREIISALEAALDARVLARATGTDSADGDGDGDGENLDLHSALRQGIRYDLQQRLRRGKEKSSRKNPNAGAFLCVRIGDG